MGRMMVEIPIPPKWKQLWDTCDLRCFIVLSLLFQMFLIFAAPLRKRTSAKWLTIPLWSAYLLADQTTNFAIGLISNSMGNTNGVSVKKGDRIPVENEDLLAFWAPFLLVHLGGPDTITAFALEDNELWIRHLFGLIFQCVATVYVFVLSLPHNRLWIPTMLMFMTGIMKYGERTRSLYLASADRFKDSMLTEPDPGPNYAKMMDEYSSKKEANLPTRIHIVPEPDRSTKSAMKAKRKGNLTELEVVQYGYLFFKKFKGLVVDMMFTTRERYHSREFFLNRTWNDAFKVVEVELNFIYDVLFTKLPVVFDKIGAFSRVFSLATVCSAIILFIFKNKKDFSDVDVMITYGLLFGALVLDMTALIMLWVSDWAIITLCESPDDELRNSRLQKFKAALLRLRSVGRLQDKKDNPQKKDIGTQLPLLRFRTRRWSETISTFNLIYYCLYPVGNKITTKLLVNFGLATFMDGRQNDFIVGIHYVLTEKCPDKLKEFIFNELKLKSELADDLETAKQISSGRGDWVLSVEDGWNSLLNYVFEVDYDQSLILWHIATELCYNFEIDEDKHNSELMESKKINVDVDKRKIARDLSGYMLYLLILQPNMMSAVAGIGEIRFRDTCAEARRFFEDVDGGQRSKKKEPKNGPRSNGFDLMRACKDILSVSTEVQPVTVKGNRSKSVLFVGCTLAKELIKIEKEKKLDKWLILSKVWVELLCYAAIHSRANTQAALVSYGGELITIVWLLMTHFGLGYQFQINERQEIAKLIIGK